MVLFNLGRQRDDILIKILESFTVGGWTRVYK